MATAFDTPAAPQPSALRELVRELSSPLLLAALVAWGAVWVIQEPALQSLPALHAWSGRVALLLFLAAFLATTTAADALRFPPPLRLALSLLMAVTALLSIALVPRGSASILLVLLAAVLAAQLGTRALVAALLALNLAVLALLLTAADMSPRLAVVATMAYGSFQVFAALVMRYARRAEAMAADLRAVNAELLATRTLLEESAREGERLRLSRELHDVAGHKLTALKLNLAVLARMPALAERAELATAAGLADELLADIRGVVRQLREHVGVDPGPAIAQLAAPLPRPRVALSIVPGTRAADVASAEALVRCAQEALTNAARHSGAAQVELALVASDGRVRLTVRDDGRGAGALRPGNGLCGMRERLEEVGGTLAIRTAPGQGWIVEATVPAGVA